MRLPIDDDTNVGYMPDYLPNRKAFAIKSHFRSYWPFYLIGAIVLAIILK